MIKTNTNHKSISHALFYFDAMLESDNLEILQYDPNIYIDVKKNYLKIIQQLIDIKLKREMNHDIDEYVLKTFDALCNKREKIELKYRDVNEQYHAISDSIFYALDKTQPFTTSPTIINRNLFQPYIFKLFPNLKEIMNE